MKGVNLNDPWSSWLGKAESEPASIPHCQRPGWTHKETCSEKTKIHNLNETRRRFEKSFGFAKSETCQTTSVSAEPDIPSLGKRKKQKSPSESARGMNTSIGSLLIATSAQNMLFVLGFAHFVMDSFSSE